MKTKIEIEKQIQRLYDEDENGDYVVNVTARETLEWVMGQVNELPA